ncbi:MAG: ABC transporter ATP-binding protein [Candidatus Methanosuratus sp.]|nr:ABC transporter ATP-binding protein [Candidatus Methanosuratincola sp.]
MSSALPHTNFIWGALIPEVYLDKVSKKYRIGRREVAAIDGVTLQLPESGIVIISGPSGAGKSTLIRIIAGLETPTSGSVYVEGVDLTRLGAYELAWFRRKKFGFKPQDPKLIPHLTILENVAVPLMFNFVERERALSIAKKLIEEVNLRERIDHKPEEISGGEYERVSLAQTIIGSPPIVILDEPTAHLDPDNSKRIADLIKMKQKESNSLYIVTTLDYSIIQEADRVVSIYKGKIIEC